MNSMGTYLHLVFRFILGGLFLVMGLNGFFNFLPLPTPGAEAGAFLGALANTGYFFPLLKLTEITVGILLLAGFFIPLALIILSPVALNILMFHLFLDPAGLVLAIAIVGMLLYLAWEYRESYHSLFIKKASYKPFHHTTHGMAEKH